MARSLRMMLLVAVAGLLATGASPAGPQDVEPTTLGPVPVGCDVAGKDYADSSCLTQTYSHFTLSPHVVHAGGTLTGTVALAGGATQVDWSPALDYTDIFKIVSGCQPKDTTCVWRVPRNARSSPWVILKVNTTYSAGTGISKDYFGVIGAGRYMLSGQISDQEGKPIEGVHVGVRGPVRASGKTDISGTYNFVLAPGSYVVSTGNPNAQPVASASCRVAGRTCRVRLDRDRRADFEAVAQLKLRYRMRPRLIPGENGMIVYPTDPSPDTFPVEVTVTKPGGETCDPGATYEFTVDGPPATATATADPCTFSVGIAQGKHQLQVTGTSSTAGRSRGVKTVAVRDFLIVGLGDSVGSGEGNPDIPSQPSPYPQTPGTPAQWQFARCDRSANSFEAQAARRIEREARFQASVTFLHLACSGAGINVGVAGAYWGIVPGGASLPLDSQLSQMDRKIGPRKPDAVIISIGANDIGFGQLLEYCIKHPTCPDDEFENGKTLDTWVADNLDALPRGYARLAARLRAAGVPADRVYITQYFDPTHNERGSTCSNVLGRLGYTNAAWAFESVVRPLNAAVAHAAARWGWNLVRGAQEGFRTHGYCSASSWIVSLTESTTQQGDINGTMHPNFLGHQFIGRLVTQKLKPDLLPKGKPRPVG